MPERCAILAQLDVAPAVALAPFSVGSFASSHSAQPTFISFATNPRSANCRAALAESCHVEFQQYVTYSVS